LLVLGLTGGIASGKSIVAAEFVRRGARLIDADRIARALVAIGTPGLAEVLARFGSEMRLPDGNLDRVRLGALVFADAAARASLNGLLHPRIRERIGQDLSEASAQGVSLCVIDAALLFELGLDAACDAVVAVDCDEDQQLRRLMARNGLTRQAAQQRIAAQWTAEARRARAGLTLDNRGSLAELDREIDRVWREMARRFAGLGVTAVEGGTP